MAENNTEKIKIELTLEKSTDCIWGRIEYNNHLIVDYGNSIAELKTQFRVLLKSILGIDPDTVEFNLTYDMYALFVDFDFLNISKIAIHSGIHPGLLRQYASGVKSPSAKQAKKIEDTIHRLADLMKNASIYVA